MNTTPRSKTARGSTALILGIFLMLAGGGAAAHPAAQQEGQPPAETNSVLAPASTLISYQGTLTNPTGTPVNATTTLQFRLYDAASGGTLKWGPETQSVQVTNGQFNVHLGSVTAISPANLTGDLWLDIRVNGEQLMPRERLTAVPYAVEAGTLSAGARTRGELMTNGDLWQLAPDSQIYGVHLWRTDEENRTHRWTLWHMNQQYGMNALQIYEYRTDSKGVECGGNPADGGMCAPRFTISSGGNIGIGTTTPTAKLHVSAPGGDAIVANGSLTVWGGAGIHGDLWPDGYLGVGGGGSFGGNLDMRGHSITNCGALTEANLQTSEELKAGGSDRFAEGDVLCWGLDRLELCATPNDRLVQAVADSAGRPIVIGAETVKVIGPVKRGDILVASNVPGYAMVNNDPVSGSVIAQALVDFDGERGAIKAMIRKW